MRCDVTDAQQVATAVDAATGAFGRIDVLINVAGQGLQASIEEIDPDDFRALLELNLVAPLLTMQAVIPVMQEQAAGSIINVSSGTTFSVLPGSGAYAASKAALNMLSAVARADLESTGITVSTMYPFITDTKPSIQSGPVRKPRRARSLAAGCRHSRPNWSQRPSLV